MIDLDLACGKHVRTQQFARHCGWCRHESSSHGVWAFGCSGDRRSRWRCAGPVASAQRGWGTRGGKRPSQVSLRRRLPAPLDPLTGPTLAGWRGCSGRRWPIHGCLARAWSLPPHCRDQRGRPWGHVVCGHEVQQSFAMGY